MSLQDYIPAAPPQPKARRDRWLACIYCWHEEAFTSVGHHTQVRFETEAGERVRWCVNCQTCANEHR